MHYFASRCVPAGPFTSDAAYFGGFDGCGRSVFCSVLQQISQGHYYNTCIVFVLGDGSVRAAHDDAGHG